MPGIIQIPNDDHTPAGRGEFPLDVLPPILGEVASAIAKVSGAPLDMVGPCVLATASACLGQGIEVRSAPGLRNAGNLYILLVKPSGAGGSTAYRFATAPLQGYQAESLRIFNELTKPKLERERATLKADYENVLADRKTARRNDDGDGVARADEVLDRLHIELAAVEVQLVPPIIWLNDCTPERLASLMAGRGETLAHFDPDGADSVAGILGVRYGKGDHAADSLHLKSYSREAVSISRQGSGKGGASNTFLASPCLSCLWIITPDIQKKLISSERMLRGGLLARFLVVSSSARPKPWARDARELPGDVADRYERAAFALLNNYRNRALGELEPIEMESGAWDLFAEHYQRYCERFDPDFSAFEARHTENAMRLALVLHAWRHIEFLPGEPASLCAHRLPLEEETARAALRLFDWFASHQAEILAPHREGVKAGKFDKIRELCTRRNSWIIASRDLISSRLATSAKEAEAMLAEWETQGRIVREHEEGVPGGGRPRGLRYRVLQSTRGLF